ncbi:MAG: purine-nucleoside phosphorylase [Bacteroidales bacterium]|nr:purine-nucleoside phosphorylase [Bacteroidales bacterium]
MDPRMEAIGIAADYIKEKFSGNVPTVGIVLGSGLGRLADIIEDQVVIPYKTIPRFPVSTAIGHKGNFIFGKLGGKWVLAMQGRFHYYEGYDMELVTMGIRVMKVLGVEYLLVSNAAGGCNPEYKVGDLVIIKDHINTLPNPLIGKNFDEFGPRFLDMTTAYDLELQDMAAEIMSDMGLKVFRGVYFGSTGPTYETPAEVRFYRLIGADLLGMSTIPEVIVGRHCGLRVFGVSVVTNEANTQNNVKTINDEEDVVVQANMSADKMTTLFIKMIERL